MLYRPQRGGLDESMREKIILLSSRAALAEYLKVPVTDISISDEATYDGRTDWESWTVLVRGEAVGFVNQDIRST